MKIILLLTSFLLTSVFFNSCSSTDNKENTRIKSLEGTDWILKSLNDKKVFTPEAGNDIYIRFNSKENRFGGFAGCNNISGNYTLIKDKIKFGPVAGTEMFCESRMEDERNFMKMFETVSKVEIKENDLLLYDGMGNIVASFKAGKIK